MDENRIEKRSGVMLKSADLFPSPKLFFYLLVIKSRDYFLS
jgi:hypothetical protein